MSLLGLPTGYWAAVAGVLGLVLGSFWTVVIHRWPEERSLAVPRSHCGACGRTLSAPDLVPLLSWIVLRGRCRGCRARVSAVYPLIEAATGVLASAAVLSFGPTWKGLAAAVLGVCLVPVVVIDLRHRLIPDLVVLPAAAVAVAAGVAADPARWWVPVGSALGAAGFLLLLSLVYPGGMGLGDVKLALLMGAVLGTAVIPAFAIAFGAGAALGLALLVRHGAAARRMAVPFGPFLAAGALAALWTGPAMVTWYAERIG